MAIGKSFLGSFFQVLFDKLSLLALDYGQREVISTTLLNEWKGMLVTINAVLDDAQDKQLSGNCLVELWLNDVKDLAYDIEDLLDEFEIKAIQAKLEVESSTSRGQVKRKFSGFSQLRSLVSETKVQEINGRLKGIVTKKACLSLRENVADRFNCTNNRLPKTSLPEPSFFGREEEVEMLKQMICQVENFGATRSIVSIVGFGGVGKTTLAQWLYNDPRVISCFEMRAWVRVLEDFNILNITQTILQLITNLSTEGKDFNWLQVKLKDHLSKKKFLVVLDDVWSHDSEKWTALLKPFEAGAKGSKIILTTRNASVSSITRALPYPLMELSLDNCISLLAFHALGATNFDRHPNLEIIGRKLAEKCKGLPLATKMLGSLLRNNEDPTEWEAILNDRIWDPSARGNYEGFLPVLKLGYVILPSYLKRCFAYCAIFPKDYEIERDELVLLWMAEGFLDRGKAKENILKLGRNYFDELVSRSFLQQSSVNSSRFLMHDLLKDLAEFIAGKTSFSLDVPWAINEDDASLEKARYASLISSMNATSKSLKAYAGMKVLRSLLLLHVGFGRGSKKFSISNKVLHEVLTNFKYLRVLSLCHCSITEVPNYVGDLKHLRYLNLSYTNIERLPESIGALCKLQTLILRGCQKLSMLPLGITNLHMHSHLTYLEITDCPALEVECFPPLPINLSFLRLENCPQIKSLPNRWHHLTSLESLLIRRCQNIKFYPKGGLPSNLRSLIIEGCKNLKQPVREWGLHMLTSLETLLIDGSIVGDGEKAWFPSEDKDAWSFLFPSSLTSLYIKNMRNVERLSSGLRNHLSSLKRLSIENCPKLEYLPEDGFPPSLQELHMLRHDY